MRLLRAKYGEPTDNDGTCSAPTENGYFRGRTTWKVDGQRIEASCSWMSSMWLLVEVLDR
jgi:hypothetical protein